MTPNLAGLWSIPPYSLPKAEKTALFADGIQALTRHHYSACAAYKNICDALAFRPGEKHAIADYPFLPARLFKTMTLKSIPDAKIQRVLTSSGTSGQAVSKIYLDAETALAQTKTLSAIVGDFIGPQRLPMLVIDAPGTVKRASQFSARMAGIVGYSIFGRDVTYALDDSMALNREAIEAFCNRHKDGEIFVFGFTFIIYRHFIQALKASGQQLHLENATLIHGGGWKKLTDTAVDNATFKKRLDDCAGIKKIHNYYGLVEQTGSVFVECAQGHLHCSNFSDIIIRDDDFAVLPIGGKGMIQVMSLLPHGYPGHVILTEDEGTWLGEDDCACGRKGKYFKIHGRIPQAEIRGCSDTYANAG